MSFHFTAGQVARALGGDVTGKDKVRAPSPGAPPSDRSLDILLDDSAPDGFVVQDYYGGDWRDAKDHIKKAMGVRWEPAPKVNPLASMQTRAKGPSGKIVATYNYTDAAGELLYQVVRFDPKDFRQRKPDSRGGWVYANDRDVLYRWADLAQYPDATVFVCEGEKDADRLASLSHCATTVCGSSKWGAECVGPLKGRNVIILEDNDEKGRTRALKAANALHDMAASIRIVRLPDLPERGDVSDWLDADPARAETLPDICCGTPEWEPDPNEPSEEVSASEQTSPIELFWHGETYDRAPRSWTIKNLLPETGAGLLSGQWGTAKTFAGLDMSAAIMTATPFAGREITRRGGVLFVAAEGATEIPIRLQGLVEHKLSPLALAEAAAGRPIRADLESLPFAWIEECPSLKDGFDRLLAGAQSAASHIAEQFDLPLALIIVDTLNAAANFKDGNDAAEGQFIMNRLNDLSRKTGAFVLAVDHFGKAVETGTRGTSAKEAAADMVLALLADRDIAGNISNTRMAVRKLRGGSTGAETPFDLKVVELGNEETTCIIEWSAERAPEALGTGKRDRWPKSLKILRAALTDAMAGHGVSSKPFPDGPELRTVTMQAVRDEFIAAYAGEAEAKRKAFTRAVKTAREAGLICSREIGGIDHLWLPNPDTTVGTSTPDRQDTP